MTSRQLYEGVLIELHKENAPNILLEDFNYFANKAVNNYVNKRYNIYDVNQQTTDDLRVLKATALLKPTLVKDYTGLTMAGKDKMATYEVIMPSDYLHILNCICIYKVNKTYKCYNMNDTWRAPATRLTADMYSLVLDNFWNKPTYKRPYYYIHNVNSNSLFIPTNRYRKLNYSEEIPSNQTVGDQTNGYTIVYTDGGDNWIKTTTTYTNGESTVTTELILKTIGHNPGTDCNFKDTHEYYNSLQSNSENGETNTYGYDANTNIIVQGTDIPDSIRISNSTSISNRERGQGIRYGNVSEVRLEIRYGTDNSVFELTDVYVDYIKAPQFIRLTQEEIDLTEDTSQMLEYPDYVCQEIINELVHLIMENISDLRLQTHPVVSQSIANPAQALAPAQGLSA